MVAHDGVATTLPADSTTPASPISDAVPQSVVDRRYGEENIKIVKIEKSTEPLGATVKNEGDAVVVGKLLVSLSLLIFPKFWPCESPFYT